MTVIVVHIPPRYEMLLSRKWSAAMGVSMQCDLSFATFHVDNKAIKITREARVNHMGEEHVAAEDVDETCFLDTNIDSFRAEPLVLQKDKILTVFSQEAQCSQGNNVWTMYFDGASSKEGAGAGVIFISPNKETFRFSFTLTFTCTNNIAEYEALLLGLKVASRHNIRNLHVIGDLELVVQQVKVAYASKNKRLKQYKNVVWDEIKPLMHLELLGWIDLIIRWLTC